MTPLRQRMLDALEVRGMAARTREAYVSAVAKLAQYYGRSPEALTAEQLQAYLVHLVRERKLSPSSLNQAGSAMKFLYRVVLGRREDEFVIPTARLPQRLPELLSRDELARLFASARHVKAGVFLRLAYASGLRLNELCHLRVGDIDTAADRMCLRVVQGKGGKDRYVPLAADTLAMLRAWWSMQPPGGTGAWLFRGQTDAAQPLNDCCAQRWYHAAASAAGIRKVGGIHVLRHCYATHMLEAGVDLYALQQWLGHRHIGTTTRYLHMTRPDATVAHRASLDLLSALGDGAAAAHAAIREPGGTMRSDSHGSTAGARGASPTAP